MDGERHIDFRAAPLRDARYAKRQLIVEPRADGGLVLTNPMPVDAPWDTAFAPLAHWGVEKAGVDWLSERLDIPRENIATIGDMPNDVLMFVRSGLSIAMGNASDQVKAQATATTDSNADEGFAKAIRRYVLPYAPR